jgi:hypothetical protein
VVAPAIDESVGGESETQSSRPAKKPLLLPFHVGGQRPKTLPQLYRAPSIGMLQKSPTSKLLDDFGTKGNARAFTLVSA